MHTHIEKSYLEDISNKWDDAILKGQLHNSTFPQGEDCVLVTSSLLTFSQHFEIFVISKSLANQVIPKLSSCAPNQLSKALKLTEA